jgi:hypothetical protein
MEKISLYKSFKPAEFDGFKKEMYTVPNIPARPLPQGMLNYGGFYYFKVGVVNVPVRRAIGMRWMVIV